MGALAWGAARKTVFSFPAGRMKENFYSATCTTSRLIGMIAPVPNASQNGRQLKKMQSLRKCAAFRFASRSLSQCRTDGSVTWQYVTTDLSVAPCVTISKCKRSPKLPIPLFSNSDYRGQPENGISYKTKFSHDCDEFAG